MSPIKWFVILLYYRPSLSLSDSIEPKQVDVAEEDLPVLHVVCRPLYPSFFFFFRYLIGAIRHIGYGEEDARKKNYSREHNRFPVLQSASFSPHGPPGKGPTALVLAYRRDGSVIYTTCCMVQLGV